MLVPVLVLVPVPVRAQGLPQQLAAAAAAALRRRRQQGVEGLYTPSQAAAVQQLEQHTLGYQMQSPVTMTTTIDVSNFQHCDGI